MTASDFREGDKVLYIPNHAHGDPNHKDCERGIVSSQNGNYVFVRYIHHGVQSRAKATYPGNLVRKERP